MALALGIDLGTSGVRTAVVDDAGDPVSSAHLPMSSPVLIDGVSQQEPMLWWCAVEACLAAQVEALRRAGHDPQHITRIAVDGTSGTLLLTDTRLRPVTPALMYDSAGFTREATLIARHAPPESIARGPSSTLARLLRLQSIDRRRIARHALHQADWIAARLMGHGGQSDANNVLKLGYDPETGNWPAWFEACGVDMRLLPRVHAPGDPFGPIAPKLARQLGLSPSARIIAGTTDSIAAFLAAGASQLGDGVTSLGTTLALKLLSDVRIDDPARGVYSHRLRGMWLAGGASNSGGGVLLAHFTREEIETLSARIDPTQPMDLDYYPLVKPGERFPIADPLLPPRLSPRPDDRARFLQAILDGIAGIEALGYRTLAALGGPPLTRVFTAGGGAANAIWTRMRAARLAVPVVPARFRDAAIGTARLAAGV